MESFIDRFATGHLLELQIDLALQTVGQRLGKLSSDVM
jgi:hypothetical protein